MDQQKRLTKERHIIDAAIKVLSEVGIKNAKMEDIAKEAGITKVTVYSYFQSKENLYLAITYDAFQALTEIFYTTIDRHKDKSGLKSTMGIFESFYLFCEQNFLYSEAMLDYFSLIRNMSRSQSSEFDQTAKDSIFFRKIQDLQNLPIKLTVKEIARGIQDGSIRGDIDPVIHSIQGWTMVIGYIKLLTASGKNDSPLMNVNLKSLKELSLNVARNALMANNVEIASQ